MTPSLSAAVPVSAAKTPRSKRMAIGLCVASLLLTSSAAPAKKADLGNSVRSLEVVPCLLPARIRRLGKLTYPERRKMTESTARDCELRGGEYTFYDRANPKSSADFFLESARAGDTEAQVHLGDVYQYLFSPANFQKAAEWYQKAAEAGSSKGSMQLARLFEKGLGVERDELKAVNLWREATGAGEELVLASQLEAAKTEADARIQRLTEQLQQRNEQAELVRQQLERARTTLSEQRQALVSATGELSALRKKVTESQQANANPAELLALKRQVLEKERLIEDQQFEIESLQGDMGAQEAQLASSLRQVKNQNSRLEKELARVTAQADENLSTALAELEAKDKELSSLGTQLASMRTAVSDADGSFAALVKELEVARQESATSKKANRKLQQLEEEYAEQSARLDSERAALAETQKQLNLRSQEVEQLRDSLDSQIHATQKVEAEYAQLEAQLQSSQESVASLTAKIDAANQAMFTLTAERDELQTALAQAKENSPQIRLLQVQLLDKEGLIAGQQTSISNLNDNMARFQAELEALRLKRLSLVKREPLEDTSRIRMPRDVKLGKYYALVIGNTQYEHLTDLKNAQADAKAMHELLRDDYGFDSKLLLDATQRDMFEATAGLITQTDEDDLVLIYYAGHGYRVEDQSFWLPVDIRSKQEAAGLGLSSETVANWIKKIPAKHVMIIADSCYSGAGIETAGGFKYSADELESMLPFLIKSRSRTMLTSGGDEPVMDSEEHKHSVFTKELLALLRENKGVLHGEAMYTYLRERVKYSANGTAINQTPTFGSIERAGHESGQFVFKHRTMGL